MLATLLLAALAAVPPAPGDCALPPGPRAWLQTTLDVWDELVRDLDRPATPLPWMVVFDSACTWHLQGEPARLATADHIAAGLSFQGAPVTVLALKHRGEIGLPDGRRSPVAPMAFASLYDDDRPFLVLALPAVWRHARGIDAVGDVDGFVRGLAAHELTHTLHLSAIARQIEALTDRFPLLPESLDDDVVQNAFRDDAAFVADLDAERALFRAAVAETDPARQRELVARGLRHVHARHARYFTGTRTAYAHLEETFLGMEGAAVLAHWRLHQRHPDTVAFVRTTPTPPWSQAYGFTLLRLVDRLVPHWPALVFCSRPLGPFALLALATAADTPTEPAPAADTPTEPAGGAADQRTGG